jgi:hypothetical protein
VGDALIDDLLDELVPREPETLDWTGVLRAARASRRRRIMLVAAAACALGVAATAPALAVLLRDYTPRLPKAADAAHAVVVLNPATGNIVVEVAPWKGHDGICYLIAHRTDGCSMRSRRGGMFLSKAPAGFTFDQRVARVSVTLKSGRTVQLAIHRFTGRLQSTFFLGTSGVARTFVFEDAAGHTISRMHLSVPPGPKP